MNREDLKNFVEEACKEINEGKPIEEQITGFKASNGYIYRFLRRHRIVIRDQTSTGQKIPENAREMAVRFFEFNKKWFD